ncbi:helix-turn-helix domain-containing protein [Kitasatospora sp. NBC_01266]|uniref:helix-turn-helix domain-containing protein n=1 Tax=Kitasatospora sp. NBC_01266 TaxID=2903572 RepID=UPI002E3590E1|nr:helix-turn-helix transcriptional regulator [Kitasatospora sp. NBC_01266]
MDQRTELSEFLRSRRARLQPQDVGLIYYGGRRRVPGLRREELAQLAGVSVAYYTRLGQGHAENVSSTVLDAIADALRLNGAEREHLSRLVRPVHRRSRAAVRPQRVRPEVQQLLDTMHAVPACVLGRRMDVLGWNPLLCALYSDYPALPVEQRNLARQVFLDPAAREFFVNWQGKAADVVASLRLEAGRYPDDPRLCALVGELSVQSEDFRQLWATHNVQDKGYGSKDLHHPVVGRLSLRYETFALPADPDQTLLTYHAAPGSSSAESLRLLASWWASEQRERSRTG